MSVELQVYDKAALEHFHYCVAELQKRLEEQDGFEGAGLHSYVNDGVASFIRAFGQPGIIPFQLTCTYRQQPKEKGAVRVDPDLQPADCCYRWDLLIKDTTGLCYNSPLWGMDNQDDFINLERDGDWNHVYRLLGRWLRWCEYKIAAIEASPTEDYIRHTGDGSYQIKNKTIVVTDTQNIVLEAFLDKQSMTLGELRNKTGLESPHKNLRDLKQKHNGIFAPYISLPGGKSKGGYTVLIRSTNRPQSPTKRI